MPHQWQECKDINCDECNRLIHEGVIMACDFCDAIGHVDVEGGWKMVNIEKTDCGEIGQIACMQCAESQENRT